jgi:hypothetical protein
MEDFMITLAFGSALISFLWLRHVRAEDPAGLVIGNARK